MGLKLQMLFSLLEEEITAKRNQVYEEKSLLKLKNSRKIKKVELGLILKDFLVDIANNSVIFFFY